ncbi:hypothetical protein [Burkholderia sp. PU8-34]
MTVLRSIDENATGIPWRFSLCAPGVTFGIEPAVMQTTASRCVDNEFATMRAQKEKRHELSSVALLLAVHGVRAA